MIAGIIGKLRLGCSSRIYKLLLLRHYDYIDLDKYISDKQLGIFIWHDYYAERKFERYKKFMTCVYENLKIEIEEKT